MACFDAAAADAEFLVVETEYPASTGPHRGRAFTPLDMLQESTVSVRGAYATYEAAVDAARACAQSAARFSGCGDWDAVFGPDPPWDAAWLDDGDDSGADARFEVKARADHDEAVEDDRKHLERSLADLKFKKALKHRMRGSQIKAAGRVHYCRPGPEPWDVPADLEVREDVGDAGVTDAAAAAATTLRYDAGEQHGGHGLAGLLGRCPKLAELHYFGALPADVVSEVLAAAPHLASTLVLLRVAGAVCPKAAAALAGFSRLERLDVSDCFARQAGAGSGIAYDGALETLVTALPRLAQLDLGFGDAKTKHCFGCSSARVEKLEDLFPAVTLTRRDYAPIPHPLPNAGEQADSGAFMAALGALAASTDPGLKGSATTVLAGILDVGGVGWGAGSDGERSEEDDRGVRPRGWS